MSQTPPDMAPYSNDTQIRQIKKDIENSKYQQTGTGRGCAGTNNPRGNRKADNPLKGIRNQNPGNPENPLKGIWDLVQNGNRSQWPKGLTVTT